MSVPGPPPPLPVSAQADSAVTDAEARPVEAPPVEKADIPPIPPLPPLFLPEPATTPDSERTDTAGERGESDLVVSDVAEHDVAEPEIEEPVVDEPQVDEPVADTDEDVVDESIDDVIVDEPVPAAVIDPDIFGSSADNAPESATPALALRGVVKEFGNTRAVDAIDLTIPAGSFFGLVGPNGAGKTTTLSMIAGLLRPDSGTIEVCGIDTATDASRAKKLIGVLPDRLRTFDRLTGRQLLYYYGVLRGLSASVVQSRIADLARAFDLVDALGRVVSDYSAGMTKKVMLAGAMIHSPRVLVLDEPFESLDPASSQVILDILETYVEHGGTVVLSSHGMALVERVCTRVAVLVEGEVLAAGTVEEVRGEMTLEQRFVQLSGGVDDAEGLEWLHTFSD